MYTLYPCHGDAAKFLVSDRELFKLSIKKLNPESTMKIIFIAKYRNLWLIRIFSVVI